MNPKGAKIMTAALEGALPILGYFFWDWNVYFVMVFYLFDYLLQQILFSLKVHKTIFKPGYFNGKDQEQTSFFKKTIVKQIGMFFLVSAILVFTTYSIGASTIKGFSVVEQNSNFFWMREMGIPQGFLLIPLFIFAGYAFYKMKFLMPKLFITLDGRKMANQFFKTQLILMGFVLTLFLLCYLVELPQLVYVLLFAVGKLIFDVLVYDKLYK